MTFVHLLMVAQAATAPAATPTMAPTDPQTRPDVVVVAPRNALADCLARHCPPDEEAAASLVAANAQYLTGDYQDARGTIRGTLDRLRDQAGAHPDSYGDLLVSAGKMDAHLGEFEAYTAQTRRAFVLSRDAHGAADARTVERRMGLGAAYLDAGRRELGLAELSGAVEDADRGGDAELVARARLKLASAIVQHSDRGREKARVAQVLAPILASVEPAMEGYRYAAKVVMAKLAARAGDTSEIKALAAAMPATAPAPLLVAAQQARMAAYAQDGNTCEPHDVPKVNGNVTGGGGGALVMNGCGSVNDQRTSQSFDKQWFDVDFTVAADGHVRAANVSRQSGQIEGRWVAEVLKTVQARQYGARPNGEEVTRRERYTLTARMVNRTGTRLMVRESRPVIEMVDISPDRTPYLGRPQ